MISSENLSFFAEVSVVFTIPLKDMTVPTDQVVILECELSKPNQKVKWFKDGKEIKPDRKRGIEPKVEGKKHILKIPTAVTEDTAEYTVKFKELETKGKLTVKGLCHYTAASSSSFHQGCKSSYKMGLISPNL